MSGTISHREMRNNSAEVLRRVEAGEELIVTNHGRPVARLSPVRVSVLDQLIAEGKARPALAGGQWSDLPDPI
ncbi:MAG TPA: type II toxin-antitoxin system prevent-host-death family antitoxin, partial [Microbacterium sp.]|uniref:type II toxin-antitoxin system Phd/YefM family antitoxin n=1 Tax=Microbacterium sp. TaxID=51671 RepID=UPI002B4673A0